MRPTAQKIRILARTPDALSAQMRAEMQALATRCDPALPADHIRTRHLEGPTATYYLAYEGAWLVGMQSYRTHTRVTPFGPKPMPVFEGRLTYKAPDSRTPGLTSRVSFLHVRRTLGRAFLLRPWVAIAHSPNPRIYAQFNRALAEVHPSLTPTPRPCPQAVRDFVHTVTGQPVSAQLVDQGDPALPAAVDISATYDALYATRAADLNQAFFDLGIFERRTAGVALTNRAVYVVGVHRPLQTALHQLRQRIARGR